MTILRSTICVLAGLLASGGVARAQQETNELPESVRQLIRVAVQAEEQAKTKEGEPRNTEAERVARRAHRAAQEKISEYSLAFIEYDRQLSDAKVARQEAADAQSHYLVIKVAAIPDPQRMQRAEEERDKKLELVADAEFKLEAAREALEIFRNPGGVAASGSTTNARPVTPPDQPVPDNRLPGSSVRLPGPFDRLPGSSDRVRTDFTWQGSRFVFRNEQDSFHLLGRMGTASYARGGQPHLAALEFKNESEHFLFYRPRFGDLSIIEWAFAKYPEFPAGDGEPKFAVWCHDPNGWHWEWTHRDAAIELQATPVPATPTPGPVSIERRGTSGPAALLAGRRISAK